MASHAAGLGFDDFNTWSAEGVTYEAQTCLATWRSFKAGKGISARTLFAIASENGWTEGNSTARSAAAKATRPKDSSLKPAKGNSAVEVWNRCEPATANHAYIQAKRGVPDGLRVVTAGDPLQQAGERLAGALVVPIVRPDGTLTGLQLIAHPELAERLKAKGKSSKQNLYGSTVEGWFELGKVTSDKPMTYIVEGIGQAWAIWNSIAAHVVVAFGSGRMGKVAAALRESDLAARLVLVPDAGKEADAQKIAAELGCAVAAMPEGEDNNFDVNDLFQRDGFDVVAALLESVTEPPRPPSLLKPVSVFDVITNPALPPGFIWDGYLPKGNVALLSAHGGTGKSTIALMLAVCAVLGRPLFGVNTEACKVLFVSLEDGTNVVRHRLAGICKAWLIDPEQLRDRLHVVDGTEHPELFTAETRGAGETTPSHAELRKIVQSESIGLVIVDNASDAFGGDEIQRRQVRSFMRALNEVARLTDCSVLLLAHVDKTTSRQREAEGGEGYSGSTAWHNSARSRLFLTRLKDGLLKLDHQKSNLGRMHEPMLLEWSTGGFPQVVAGGGFDDSRQQGRADDASAVELLKLIAEFESRGQYCSPATTSRNNVNAVLKSERAFQKLKLRPDDTKRIVNQCQRAKWIEPLDYCTRDRKPHQRWTVTVEGRLFAGISAPTAPTAPTSEVGTDGADGTNAGAPTAPTGIGGVGDRACTEDGASGNGDD
jgi:phage/plasmid primase-like uncharacterized protein